MWRLETKEDKRRKAVSCPVVENKRYGSSYCRLTLKVPEIASISMPGQFVIVYMPPEHPAMLPRPFSIYRADRRLGEISILFEVKGRGTSLMAASRRGDNWKMLGPLGTGFPSLPAGSLMVAGGIGIAPLVFLAASSEEPRRLIAAARNEDRLICLPEDLSLPGLVVAEATEDGSRGKKGRAVDLVPSYLPDSSSVFACGPREMLAAVAVLCRQAGKKAWLSLEEKMACGIGACLGCAVRTTSGYRRICRDGPVFPAEEVIFDE